MQLILKPRQDKQLRRGYPWIFANQVARVEGAPGRGDVVPVINAEGESLGRGFYHDTSQIAVRMVTFDPDASVDAALFERRIHAAHAVRASYYPEASHYRVLYGDSDGIPGTIVDRYGDVLTWTSLSFGIEQHRDDLLDILSSLYRPRAIVERNDVWLRSKDDLPAQKGVLRGVYEEDVLIEEQGVTFAVDVVDGPKTGFFIDQRDHRACVSRFARDRRVLDVCCADGGFGLLAAAAGAASVDFIDSSAAALSRVQANAERNDIDSPLHFHHGDALDRLGELVDRGQQYDLIVLDPPAFAKSKRHLDTALPAYQRLNINALQLLSDRGILATSSCSQALKENEFVKLIRYCSRKTETPLSVLYRGFQPPDHPVLDAMPETHYLKFYVVQKTWR